MAWWVAAGAFAKKLVIAEATAEVAQRSDDVLGPTIEIGVDMLITAIGTTSAIALIGLMNFDLASLLPPIPGVGALMSNTTSSGATGQVDVSQLDLRPIQMGDTANGFPVTSDFGPRVAPTAGASSNHDGVDIGAPTGTPLYAPAAGKVNCYGDPSPKYSKTSNADGYGDDALEFISSDPNVPDFFIGHNSACISGVVVPGQKMGEVGSEGVSTGPHPHITQFDANGTPVNPSLGFIELIMGKEPPIIKSSGNGSPAGDAAFDIAYKFSAKWEGSGCSNHPADIGGLTCYGVAQNYSGSNVTSLGADGAKAEIKKRFWDAPNCGQYDLALAVVCLDTHLNFGSWDWLVPSTGLDAQAIVQGRKDYRYQRVAEAPSQSVFLQGWLNRDNDLEQYIKGLN